MFVQEVVNYYLNNIPYLINKECYVLTEIKTHCSEWSENDDLILFFFIIESSQFPEITATGQK